MSLVPTMSYVETTLQCVRDDTDTVHGQMYESVLEIVTKIGVDESMPTRKACGERS